MNRLSHALIVSGLTAILSLGLTWTTVAQADSRRHFTFDVAMNSATAGVNFPDGGIPGRSLVGIFNGNIYPKGTLRSGDDNFDPADDDGIGTWRCHFTGLNDVALAPDKQDSLDFPLTGAITYYFQIKRTLYDRSESMIMVMGLNSHTSDDEDSVSRIHTVVGGTGRYAGATGEVRETVLGRNSTGARNLRFRFKLRGVRGDHYFHDDDDDD
jgi:hypothetical protein